MQSQHGLRIYSQPGEPGTNHCNAGKGKFGKRFIIQGQQKRDGESLSACAERWSGLRARSWKICEIYRQALNPETSFKCMKVWKWYSVSLKIEQASKLGCVTIQRQSWFTWKTVVYFCFQSNAVMFVDGKLLSLVARFYTLWFHRFMMDEESQSLRYNI